MKAIQVEDGRLTWGHVEAPALKTGEVLIDVEASAVNRADLLQARGGYPPPPGASPIIGLECAGVVRDVADDVSRVKAGDRVCALLAGGGYAEQVAVPAGQVLPIPAGLSVQQAAALPEVFATAFLNLYMEGQLQVGERVLLHAGASGVGTAALQLCRLTHNPTFVTVGSADKLSAASSYGADAGWNRHDGAFVEAVNAWHGGAGIHVVLDPVGASYLADNLSVLALDGRIVLIGLMGGLQTEINLGALMMKRARLVGSTLRNRSIAAKSAVMDALLERVWPAIERGEIEPVIDTVMPMSDAQAAHELVAADGTVGKVVLSLS